MNIDIEIVILVAVAAFVISRLYAVLGQRTGAEQQRTRRMREQPLPPAPLEDVSETERPRARPTFSGPAASGLEAISERDEAFVPEEFLVGARRAYEIIVAAFADGDREALRPLLDGDVYAAWDKAIAERTDAGGEPMRLLRIRSARIVEASVDGRSIARISVSFEADLGDGETMRKAREIWTFMRSLDSGDPNWLLDEVVAAS